MNPDVVSEELKSIASKWEALSRHLSLPQEEIEALKSEGGSDEDNLEKVLRLWLKREQSNLPEVLMVAVSNIDPKLADDLKEKYCSSRSEEGVNQDDEGSKQDQGEEGEANEEMEVEKTGAGAGDEEKTANGSGEMEVEKIEAEGEEGTSSHVYTERWSKLTREDIVDRIKGVIYGQAIGDALGLATEFMNKKEAMGYYKKELTYDSIVQDFHRSRWEQGDWTDDTDQMLLIMLMLTELNGKVDQLDFASRMYNWMRHGFKELGDIGGMGIGLTVSRTLQSHNFLTEPVKAAETVWENSGRYLAANGAIMRTSILGAFNFNDISKVSANTINIAKVTHADPRCSASCVAVTTAIALMLQGAYNPMKKDQLSTLIKKSIAEANKCLEHKDQQKEMEKHINSSLKNLKLDGKSSIGYTFKALGSGFYGLRVGTDFRKTITEVIMEGGDADSNAAVCGALMGCKLGFKALPEDLLQFKHREWLDKKVDAFLKITGLV